MSEALVSEDGGLRQPIGRVDTAHEHVLAIDQGTTGTRMVIAADGRVAGRGNRRSTSTIRSRMG